MLSGSAKPVRIVGMPLSASAGMIGSVPPERVRIGRTPNAVSNASCAILTTSSRRRRGPDASRRQLLDLHRCASGAASCRRLLGALWILAGRTGR